MASQLIAGGREKTKNTHMCDRTPKIASGWANTVFVEKSKVDLHWCSLEQHRWYHSRPLWDGGPHCHKHNARVTATSKGVFVENKKVVRHDDPITHCNIGMAIGPGKVTVITNNSSVWSG